MGRMTLIAGTTAAVTDRELNLQSYQSATIGADLLAGSETVTIKIAGKGITSEAGGARQLTATVPSIRIEGGLVYQVDKSATPIGGACEVYFAPGPGINE